MVLTELPKEEVALLRFLKSPFKVYGVCEDLEDDEQPQFMVKVLREEICDGLISAPHCAKAIREKIK